MRPMRPARFLSLEKSGGRRYFRLIRHAVPDVPEILPCPCEDTRNAHEHPL